MARLAWRSVLDTTAGDAGGDHDAGGGVSKIVQTDQGEVEFASPLAELVEDPLGPKGLAVRTGEDQAFESAVGVGSRLEGGLAVQGGHDSGGQADPCAARLGLGLTEVDLPVDGGQGPADVELVVHEMHVRPVQGEDLAAAHTAAEHDLEQVGEPIRVMVRVVPQEGRGLVWGPAGAYGGAGFGGYGVLGRVVAQPPRPHRVVQGVARHSHRVVNGGANAAGGELRTHPGVDVFGPQVDEQHAAERRDQVALDARLVTSPGVRGQRRALRLQPLVQEQPDAQRPVLVHTPVLRIQHPRHLPSRLRPAGEPAPPPSPALAALPREVHRVGPPAMRGVGGQPQTPRTQLLPTAPVLAPAPPIHPTTLGTLRHGLLLEPSGDGVSRVVGVAAEREGRGVEHRRDRLAGARAGDTPRG